MLLRSPVLLLTAVLAAPALSGCGSGPTEGARAAALAFEGAVRDDPARACALLAPSTIEELQESHDGTPCPQALQQEQLEPATTVTRATVQGHTAQVVLDDDIVFLSLFDDGWKVVAAGCERESDDPSEPATCSVQGG